MVTPLDKTDNAEWLNSIHFSHENAEENNTGFILWLTECLEIGRILKNTIYDEEDMIELYYVIICLLCGKDYINKL